MKIAKKVLSVLLAIAMVLGSFAVAASANGDPDTASHQVKFWITLSPITSGGTWSSDGTTYETAVWEDSQTSDITVEPGQRYMVAVHVTTNYYVGHCNALLFYDSRLLDAGEIYNADTGKKATIAKTKQMTLWNEYNASTGTGNPFLENSVAAYRVQTPSSLFTDKNFLMAMNRCMDDNGDVYFKKLVGETGTYANATEAKAAGWGFFKMDAYPNPEVATTTMLDGTTEYYVAFPIQIPEDAQEGDTYQFVMPEENIKRKANTSGDCFVGECPDGDASAEILADLSNAYFNEDQYFDFSGVNNVSLKVSSGSSTVDYSKLQAKYDEVKDTVVANYDNTDDFVAALAAAKTILDEQTADQTAVDNALTALEEGYAKLTIKGADYTKLTAAKSTAALVNADDYEQDANWTAFQTAYDAAKAIADGLDITHQTEIDNAATALTTAIANLTKKVVEADADYTTLNAEISAAQKIVDEQQASWYTTDSWSAFTTALAEAKAVPTGLKESQQPQIDAAATALSTARQGLKDAAADYTNLDALIAECSALVSSDYTAASWSALSIALTAANAVAKDLPAKQQSTIDTAYNNLKTAKDNLVPLGAANYQPLIDEIAKGTPDTEDYYTADSWAAYQTVLAAAQAMVDDGSLKEDEQAQISKMVEDLIAAKAALVYVDADYTAVDAALAKIPSDDDLAAYYTTATATAVIAARNAVVRGYDKSMQDDVDKMASDIETAVANLVLIAADTTALKTAIDKANAVDSSRYTEDSYNAMKAELDKATALYNTANLTKKDNQAAVDAQTAALTTAYNALVPAGADYSKVKEAIDSFEALTESHWTAATWSAAKAKYEAAKVAYNTTYTVDQQAELDAYATELNAAINALVPAPADFTALDTLINTMNVYLTSWANYYTDEYKTAANEGIASAKTTEFRALTKKDQATVDAKTAELQAIYDSQSFKDFDYTQINAAKAAYDAIDRSLYTDDSLAINDDLFAQVEEGWTMDPRKTDGSQMSPMASHLLLQSRILKWESNLVLKPVEEKADYTDLDAAIAEAEALIAEGTDNYTDESVKALNDALAAGKALSRDLLASEQATVDAATDAINDAMPLTEKDAVYTALDELIADAKKISADDYTAASYKAMTDKLAAAEAVDRNLKISDQQIINDAANALSAAIDDLEAKAVYTALDELIAYAKTINADEYTATSYKAMTDKLEAAEAVDRDLGSSDQQIINDAANALSAAIDALAKKPVDVDGAIQLVEWTPSEDAFNIYYVTVNHVNGTYPCKIQFIDVDGNTRTITRRSTAATVTTYDANGNVCHELSRDAAYDVWAINVRLAVGTEVKAIAKYDFTWESTEVAYKFVVTLKEKTVDTNVYSITPDATAGKPGRIGVTIVTGKNVQGVRTVMSTGATLTQKAFTEADGKKIYEAQASCYLDGANVIKVQVKYDNVWHDAGSFTYVAAK